MSWWFHTRDKRGGRSVWLVDFDILGTTIVIMIVMFLLVLTGRHC
jgi:hypothetical protein